MYTNYLQASHERYRHGFTNASGKKWLVPAATAAVAVLALAVYRWYGAAGPFILRTKSLHSLH